MAIYRGLSGPPRPKPRKSLPGPPAAGPPESLAKVSKKSFQHLFKTCSRLSRLFPDFFQTLGGPRGRSPERLFFLIFSGFRARRGPRDPCSWSAGSQGEGKSLRRSSVVAGSTCRCAQRCLSQKRGVARRKPVKPTFSPAQVSGLHASIQDGAIGDDVGAETCLC